MKSILFILIEFPPANTAGVFRPLRFINACAEAGYCVIVIAPEFDAVLNWPENKLDEKLCDLINKNVILYRVPLDDIKKLERTKLLNFYNTYFNVTDKFAIAWQNNVRNQIPEILDKHNPVCIITSLPPFSIGELVSEISIKYKVPFILDLRDAWAHWAITPNASYLHYLKKASLERKVFKQASAVISVTPQLVNVLKNTQPSIDPGKFNNIYNSVNTGEIDFDNPVFLEPIDSLKEINIGYIGAFYFDMKIYQNSKKKWWQKKPHHNLFYSPVKEDWLYRTPYYFLRALDYILKKQPNWKQKIVFHHIGETPSWVYDMVKEVNGDIRFVSHGYLDHNKVKVTIKDFDILLATSEKVRNDEHYCLPSKLFTYLQSGKPVIGFVTAGIQKDFIKGSGVGETFDPDLKEETAVLFEEFIKSGFSSKLNKEYLTQFDSNYTNAQFLKILENVSIRN